MRNALRPLAPVILLTLLGTSLVSAQHPQVRRGFWIGFGVGYGSAGVSCEGCLDFERESGSAGVLRLGGTVNDQVLLGAEITGWSKSESGITSSLGNVTASVSYYPAPRSGLFVTGGLGFSGYSETDDDGPDVDGSGFGFTVGAGYDLRVGRNISLTPLLEYVWGSVGDLQLEGTPLVAGWKQNLIYLGLGVTFH